LFDYVTYEETLSFVKKWIQEGETNPEELATKLCKLARNRKSRDDISAVVCFFKEDENIRNEADETEDAKEEVEEEEVEEAVVEAAVAKKPEETEKKKKKKKKKNKKSPPTDAAESPASSPVKIVKVEAEKEAERKCDVCSKKDVKLLICGRCKNVRYCSSSCQKLGWKSGHKTVCKVANPDLMAVATATTTPILAKIVVLFTAIFSVLTVTIFSSLSLAF
jgi:hypothetical protein